MKWISVKDRLPEKLSLVLVWSNTSLFPTIAHRMEKNDWYYHAVGGGKFSLKTEPHIKITHWMPLPEPPKNESK